jgi:hypothetical protein
VGETLRDINLEWVVLRSCHTHQEGTAVAEESRIMEKDNSVVGMKSKLSI